MSNALRQLAESVLELKEAFTEEELLAHSHHKRAEHVFLLARNTFVAVAALLFAYLIKAIAYFFGAGAYFCEILLLTDCFSQKVPHREMFMAYCFGPMYILLGISYLLH